MVNARSFIRLGPGVDPEGLPIVGGRCVRGGILPLVIGNSGCSPEKSLGFAYAVVASESIGNFTVCNLR